MTEFEKFAIKHKGISSLSLHRYHSVRQSGSIYYSFHHRGTSAECSPDGCFQPSYDGSYSFPGSSHF